VTILELMKLSFDATEEVESVTARLVAAHRFQRTAAGALSDALMRESSARLCKILTLEAAARRKAPKEKDVPLPGRLTKGGKKRK
jgi:hypothetical protein